MSGRRDEGLCIRLVCPPAYTPTCAVRAGPFVGVGHVEVRRDEVHLEPRKRRLEATSEPADCVAGGQRPGRGGEIADRIKLRLLEPVGTPLFAPLPGGL